MANGLTSCSVSRCPWHAVAIGAALMMAVVGLAACVEQKPIAPPIPTPFPTRTPVLWPTLTSPPTPTYRATVTPTATLSPTATLIPTATLTPTITPTPTLSPNAITAETARQVRDVLILDGRRLGGVWGVDVSPDARLIAVATTRWSVFLFDAQTGDLLRELEHHRDTVYAVAFTPDSSRLISGSRDRTIQVWDPWTGERLYGARAGGEVSQVAVSPEGRRVAGVGFFSAIGEVWQITDAASLFNIEGHNVRLRSVAWSPDNRWFASGDSDGIVLLHDPQTGQVVQTIGPVIEGATALAFSPTGDTLAVGTSRGVIGLWKIEGLRLDASWAGHSGNVLDLAFSPDGSLLVTTGDDGMIRLWNVAGLSGVTGVGQAVQQRLASLGGHGATVRSLAFSRDGSTLVSGGDDGRVFVWRVAP